MAPLQSTAAPYKSRIQELEDELALNQSKSAALNEKIYKKPKTEWNDVITQALLTLAPAVIGSAIADTEGGIAGLQAGLKGGDSFLQSVQEERQRQQALALQEKADIEKQSVPLQSQLNTAQTGVLRQEASDIEAANKQVGLQMDPEVRALLVKAASGKGVLTPDEIAFIQNAAKNSPAVAKAFRQAMTTGARVGGGQEKEPLTEDVKQALVDYQKGGDIPPESYLMLVEKGYIDPQKEKFANTQGGFLDIAEEKFNAAERKQIRERSVVGYEGKANEKKFAAQITEAEQSYSKIEPLLDRLELSLRKAGDAQLGEEATEQALTLTSLITEFKKKDNYGAAFTELEAELASGLLPVLKMNPLTGSITRAQIEGLSGRDPLVTIQKARELLDIERATRAVAVGLVPKSTRTEAGKKALEDAIKFYGIGKPNPYAVTRDNLGILESRSLPNQQPSASALGAQPQPPSQASDREAARQNLLQKLTAFQEANAGSN